MSLRSFEPQVSAAALVGALFLVGGWVIALDAGASAAQVVKVNICHGIGNGSLVNGTPVLSGLLTANLQTVLYSASLTLSAGDTISFATGPGQFGGLHPGHVGLSGTITAVP